MQMNFRGKTYNYVKADKVEIPSEKCGACGEPVEQVELDGCCDPPNSKNKSIFIDKGLSGFKELETNLHEFTHACVWDLKEECVSESAHDIARALWRLGYRKTKKKK